MKFLLVLFCVLSFHFTNAQKVIVNQFTKYGSVSENKDEIDVIRELTIPDSGYIVAIKEFTANGKLRLVGNVIFEYGRMYYHGDVVIYNHKGKKIEAANYVKGVQHKPTYYFYENGAVKKKIEYEKVDRGYMPDFWIAEDNKIQNIYFYVNPKLMYYADSLGKVFVENGNGYLLEKLNYLDEYFIEEGNYIEGRKDGVWKGKNELGTKIFTEKYKNGKLLSGVMNYNNRSYKYSALYTRPIFGLGNNHVFQAYLEKINFHSIFSITKTNSLKIFSFHFLNFTSI